MVTLWRNVKYHSFIHSLDGPLKIKTDGGRSRVRELGSIGSFSFYYNFVKRGPFATKFCTHSVTENVNKCCKFCYCMISTFSCVHTLWLNRMY